jgi:glycine hydroxymethyltransferase
LVSGGTDNHLLLLDLRRAAGTGGAPLTGKLAEEALHRVGITVNKNAVPGDPQKPWVTSGVRMGTPALTTRGMGPGEMQKIGQWIIQALKSASDEAALAKIREEVRQLCQQFPVPAAKLAC